MRADTNFVDKNLKNGKTPANFGQISAGVWPEATILAGATGQVDHCFLVSQLYDELVKM